VLTAPLLSGKSIVSLTVHVLLLSIRTVKVSWAHNLMLYSGCGTLKGLARGLLK